MEFVRVKSDPASLERYCSLFNACFPKATHFSANYLQWLYRENPEGEVVGFDAFDGTELAAHYVCIPIRAALQSVEKHALLSLNTATHPRYQGKGLFTKLATLTYESGALEGHEFVIGVANANSTPGFIRRLGFQLVAPLEARIGFGMIGVADWDAVLHASSFRRVWNRNSLEWRVRNPENPIRTYSTDAVTYAWAPTHYPAIRVWAEIPCSLPASANKCPSWLSPKVFIGMFPSGLCSYRGFRSIPDSFKPAPLNFIFRNLQQITQSLDADRCLVNFLDFDAY